MYVVCVRRHILLPNESFWLKLLKENCKIKTPLLFWAQEKWKATFKGEHNPFWQLVLDAWKKMLKRIENGIQDRTSETRQLYEVLDTEQ